MTRLALFLVLLLASALSARAQTATFVQNTDCK